LSSVVNVKLVI